MFKKILFNFLSLIFFIFLAVAMMICTNLFANKDTSFFNRNQKIGNIVWEMYNE